MYVKEHNTYDEQINKLIQRGCTITDKNQAVNILKRVNYYRLSAYFLPFKQNDESYISGTSIDKIYGIYEFDKRLTVMLCGLIEEIEVFIKTQIAYYHSLTYGALGYLDDNNFLPSKADKHHDLINLFNCEVHNNADSLFVKHHIQNYNGQFPLWVAVELFTLGNISQFYSQMKAADKKAVSRNITELTGYAYQYKQLESLLFCLTHLRNKCAHFTRLYFHKFGTIPNLPKYVTQEIYFNPQNVRIYQYLFILKLLTPVSERWNNFVTELEALIDEYSEHIDLRHIGFPDNWKSELLSSFT
ncbi:MAG: Abi family protein [Oscillospiraceae bacterium]